ncbi:MAG: uracil-DNA glycosylase, partial [bacterium]|nr:uracil-DNA glycosylase [bacterium]
MTKEEALAEVAKRIAACEQCKYQPDQNPVPGEGNPDAEIMFVGEAPGKKENETGRPFVGAAGKFLNEMLNSIGLEREDIFIANVIKYQPPENRDPLPDEIALQLPFLKKQIAIIKPKLVCFLGRHALHALLPDETRPISVLHGQLIFVPKKLSAVSNQLSARNDSTAESREPIAESSVQAYLPLYHPAA